MKDFNGILKYCAVLALSALLVACALILPGPDGGTSSDGLWPWLQQRGQGTGEPGVVMVLQLPGAAGADEGMEEIPSYLSRIGVERGDLLGRDSLLVRVPESKVAAARELAGSALQDYKPAAKLALSLASGPAGGDEPPDDGMLSVNVTVFRSEDKAGVVQAVNRLGGAVLRGEAGTGRVLRLQLPRPSLEELAGLPSVVYIEPSTTYNLTNDRARDLVAATPLGVEGFLSLDVQGLTGDGQIIGLADSGLDIGQIDDIHPDLAGVRGRLPKVVMLRSWAGAPLAADPSGHGTHMAATIAGTGAASSGRFQGLAPGASIYFQGLLDESGQLDPPPDLNDLFAPAYAAGVRIHVNGWGGEDGGYQSTASETDSFIWNHPDFLVIFSAGNGGPGAGSLTPEAHTKNGLVVGASQSPHPLFDPRQDDSAQVSDFSGRGPTSDGRLKPELLAPGALISARARQVVSEFDLGDGYYTYLEGTSMASAVAGGSAALLREYLIKYEQAPRPTAALLKAALVSGASAPQDGPDNNGFGVLDLGGTVLSLHENTLELADSRDGVADGATATYTFQVQSGEAPFKATLAWTDWPVAPGAGRLLVNNLDLVVEDPSGRTWQGNSFLGTGKPDDVNNVEQVYINRPEPGTYTIHVRGTGIAQNSVSGAASRSQDYALVYGQPLVRSVVESASSGAVTLASGAVISLDEARVSVEQDGRALSWPLSGTTGTGSLPGRPAGMDIYLPPEMSDSPAYAYLAGRTWQARGVQLIDTGDSSLFTEINPDERSGGFLLAGHGEIRVNGSALADMDQLPPGGEIQAIINPSTQTVWSANVVFREADGFFDRIELPRRELFLVGRQQPLTLAERPALAYLDEIADAERADIPFGAGASPSWDSLLPGLRVKLMLSPGSGDVMYVGARRRMAVGMIAGIDADTRTITMGSGNIYKVGLGVSLQLDGEDVDLAALKPGQHAIAVLFPETLEILALSAHSQMLYGRVINVDTRQQLFYLVDNHNELHILRFSAETPVFRWGLPARMGAVEPGSWARLYLDPGTDQIGRLDIAEAAPEKTEIFKSYDPSEQVLTTDKGAYRLTGRTLVAKNGYPVAPEDLVAGERVTLNPLQPGENGQPLLAAVTAQARTRVTTPHLEVAAPWRGEYVILSGITTADRLYIYLPGKDRLSVPVEKGRRFLFRFQPEADAGRETAGAGEEQDGQQGLVVQLVAVNAATGGVAGQSIPIPAQGEAVLKDMDGHWAESDVAALLAQSLLRGYPDGTFRPDASITRSEFAALLAGALGWSGTGSPLQFSDAGDIPEWARNAIECGVQRGQILGYPDNTFRPDAPITRIEAAALLDHTLEAFTPAAENTPPLAPPWEDWALVPDWARPTTARLLDAKIFAGRTLREFVPFAPLKRGEAAAAINRLLEYIRQES